MEIAARFACLAIGYVLGLFQTGYLYGKSKGIDIRTKGSGNAGTTNSLRVLGTKAGAITFLGDCLKAILAIVLAKVVFGGIYPESIKLLELYAGFGTVLGHNYPFYLKFKGGKGIACTAGVMLALCPWIAAICFVVFVIIFIRTHYVSLGSIMIVSIFLVGVIVMNHMGYLDVTGLAQKIEFDVLAGCFTAMAIWRHRANIKRLMSGTENKVNLFKKEENK